MTLKQAIERLKYLVDLAPEKLRGISEEAFSFKPNPGKWSKKEILGHLIDSAAANHQRFVRGQFEELPEIDYEQDNWNQYSFHQGIDGTQIISFWTAFNKQLIEIVSRIPQESLSKKVKAGGAVVTIEYVIIDYVVHLDYHLKQIIEY